MATTATPATGIPATGTRGRFAWHELMTTDPKAAKAFYTAVIGWKTSSMQGSPMEYDFWQTGDSPDTMIGGLMAMPPGAAEMGAPPSWLAYIEVPDTDAMVDQVVKLGGKVVMPRTVLPDVILGLFEDPEGHTLGLVEAAPAAAQ